MGEESVQRRLTAILAADVVGYSSLMQRDETRTLTELKILRKQLLEPLTSKHQGRIFKETGDGTLVEFASAVKAVQCAVELQRAMAASESAYRLILRVGVNLGDVMVEGEDLYGDGVNLAARIEGLAQPGGVAISDTVHEHVQSRIGIVFVDGGNHEVKNVERPVHVWTWSPGVSTLHTTAKMAIESFPPVPGKPSIVVLPFENMSGDPEQGYFADGITDDIITDLSKVSGLFVIARNSSFAYKGRATDLRRVSRELGVRYILEGSVRRAANRVRVNAQMIDGTTGGHLWADRYERDLEDVFAVQEELTCSIVDALKVKLTADEEARRGNRGKVNPEAYDLLIRARQNILQLRPEALVEARSMLERAIELDPGMPEAHAHLSVVHSVEYANASNPPNLECLPKALDLARKAVELDEREPWAYHALAIALMWSRQLDEAQRAAERIIELDANFALGYAELGNVHHFKGDHQGAVELYKQANSLDPQFDLALHFLGRALLVLCRFDEAEVAFKRRLALLPRSDMTRFYLVSLYGHTGRHDEARSLWRELLDVNPDFSVDHYGRVLPYRDPATFRWFVDGVKAPGIEIQ